MKAHQKKLHNRTLRQKRIRKVVTGTTERPRLSVHVSNRHITAQVINDEKSHTLVYVSTVGQKLGDAKTLSDRAAWVGAEVAKKAKAAKVKYVAFDRNGKLYHGRVKALADAARDNGLEF